MLENIKRKWNEASDKTEKDNIESCKKHPKIWIGAIVIIALIYIGIFLLIIINIMLIPNFYSKYMLVLILAFISMLITFYYLEKELFNVYKKAFPKI